jgi:hypothetical protein
MVAIFDYIRWRTKVSSDGAVLIETVLAPGNPHLILSDLDSKSGQNDQKGFMQIYEGPDLTEENAAPYLIFASRLARRIEEAKIPKCN